MATVVADLVATIRADDQASGKLDWVGQKVASLGGAVGGVLGGAAKAAGPGLLGLGTAGGAGMGMAARGAMDFEPSMDAVNAALGGVAHHPLVDLEQQALDLRQATKYSAGVVAPGPLRRLAAREHAGDRPARAGRDGRLWLLLDA